MLLYCYVYLSLYKRTKQGWVGSVYSDLYQEMFVCPLSISSHSILLQFWTGTIADIYSISIWLFLTFFCFLISKGRCINYIHIHIVIFDLKQMYLFQICPTIFFQFYILDPILYIQFDVNKILSLSPNLFLTTFWYMNWYVPSAIWSIQNCHKHRLINVIVNVILKKML